MDGGERRQFKLHVSSRNEPDKISNENEGEIIRKEETGVPFETLDLQLPLKEEPEDFEDAESNLSVDNECRSEIKGEEEEEEDPLGSFAFVEAKSQEPQVQIKEEPKDCEDGEPTLFSLNEEVKIEVKEEPEDALKVVHCAESEPMLLGTADPADDLLRSRHFNRNEELGITVVEDGLVCCELREGSFHSGSEVMKHVQEHSGVDQDNSSTEIIKRYKCKICRKLCIGLSHLTEHMVTHTEETKFKCNICNKLITHKCSFQRHMLAHEKLLKCEVCSLTFTDKRTFKRHLRTHRNETRFDCMSCGKIFRNNSAFKLHLLIHTGDKQFKCEVCSKLFIRKSHLESHMLTHTGEKRFECEICGKTFSHKTHVSRHMFVHTQDKKFKCEVCSKSFILKTYLKDHMLTHTRKMSLKCEICSKVFSRKRTFNRHKLAAHSGK